MLRLQSPLPERYTSASGDELAQMIGSAKAELGPRLFVLGHHYQRDDVMRWADARGDSFGLSRTAATVTEAEFIVFCGVHFMAESADVLTGDHQRVLLPDLNAGCSMADMADIEQVEEAWEELAQVSDVSRIVPITYMNSSAALKAFVGRHDGRGVHLVERPGRPDLGSGGRAGPEGPVLPRPAPRPQHRLPAGLRGGRHAGVEPTAGPGRAERRRGEGVDAAVVEGPLLGASTVPPRARDGVPGRAPRRDRDGPPGVLRTTSSRWRTSSGRPTTSFRASPRPRAGR